MKYVLLENEVTFGREDVGIILKLEKNHPYVLPDYMVDSIKEQDKNNIQKVIRKCKDLYLEYDKYNGQDLSGKHLFILREGGYGDLIFLTPFIKELKKKYPSSKIYLCASKRMAALFDGIWFYDGFINYPLDFNIAIEKLGYRPSRINTYFLSLEKMIEENPDAEKMNIYDLISTVFKIPLLEYKPEIYVDQEIVEQIETEFNFKDGKLNIGFQIAASSPIRTWKPQNIIEFFNVWNIENTRFFILESPKRGKFVENLLRKVTNKTIEIINLAIESATMQRTVAIVKNLDLVVAPDSALNHIAACFGIPMVGLFGAFHSDLRLKYYKNAVGINSMSDCPYARGEFKACFDHGNVCQRAIDFNRLFPPCMDLIRPTTVIGAIAGLMIDLGKLRLEDKKFIVNKNGIEQNRVTSAS